jgi:ribonuclease HII
MPIKFDYSLLPPSPDLCFEAALWDAGIPYVAGIDEAGRGALAGPVAAGAIILPADKRLADELKGVRDSKQMTPSERRAWAARLPGLALTWAVGFASAQEIDEIGIVPATRLAIQRALAQLAPPPLHLLLDFLRLPECSLPQTALIKGDARSLSIAAASILAKTARDQILCQLDQEFPGYGFAAHKGYGTAAHIQSIQRLGASEAHRHSFQIHKLGEI